MDDTIEVNGSPLPDQVWAGVRQIAPAFMAFALGKGWLDSDLSILLGAIGGVVWPIVYGQLKTRERAQQLAHVARSAPDCVAVVK